jgi:hypothetical protein
VIFYTIYERNISSIQCKKILRLASFSQLHFLTYSASELRILSLTLKFQVQVQVQAKATLRLKASRPARPSTGPLSMAHDRTAIAVETPTQSQSRITTNRQSASLSWCLTPIWDPQQFFFLLEILFIQFGGCVIL